MAFLGFAGLMNRRGKTDASGDAGWIVAFLGNPGMKYEKTRHNAGFMAADALERLEDIRIDRIKFKALTRIIMRNGEKLFLLKPQTYMNLSGDAVSQAASFYKIPAERIITVFDDKNIPLGKIRVKRSGSDGGHNGIKSIIERLGTQEFPRVKIGIGTPEHPDYDHIDWVIGKLSGSELKTVQKSAETAVHAVLEIIDSGVDSAMNKFN